MIQKPSMGYRFKEGLRSAFTGSHCRPCAHEPLTDQDYRRVASLHPLLTAFLKQGKEELESKGYTQVLSSGILWLNSPLTESISLKIVTPSTHYKAVKTDKITLPCSPEKKTASVIIGREPDSPYPSAVAFCDVPFYVDKIVRKLLRQYAGGELLPQLAGVLATLGMHSIKRDRPQFDMFVHLYNEAVSTLHSTLVFGLDKDGTYCLVKSLGAYPMYIGYQGDEGVIGLRGNCGLISIATS